MKITFYALEPQQTEVEILLLDKINIKLKLSRRDKEDNYILVKGMIKLVMILVNTYVPYNQAPIFNKTNVTG